MRVSSRCHTAAGLRAGVRKDDGCANQAQGRMVVLLRPCSRLDALKVVQADQVTLEFKAPNKPGVLRTGPDFLYVIMPVNLQ